MLVPVILIIFVPILVAIVVLVFIHQSRTRKILQEDLDIDKSRSWAAQFNRQDFEGSSLSDVVPDIYLPPIIFPSQDLNLFARSFHSDANDTRYHTGVSVSSRA
ncbi:hypothetical protein MERGE_003180 [Pneumocystis wakefieldiae]|uniref:Uncharacterized protein n=1 Tax=Pneumocystis wakefieldiae TaxID=38082 RepID=A0A899FZP6_9ASCO|nr:hypothetical protein MERGE_003180 [Pneumocystis wakefieldiae]